MPVPSWGLVTASAHQHLILIRGGRVVHSAQGSSAWKWPGDTVALVDTSVQRLQFTADQVTRERVGVGVTGLAVFRVVKPTIAWRMLDLDQPERHRTILQEMFIGATRRLVANLGIEDCLTRRKDALAAELMAEVAPVVQGSGRVDDVTDGGWGIALDTIEIQDVKVLSREVFDRMQAPFRAELALQAGRAQAEVEAQRAVHAAEAQRAQAALERQRAEAAAEQAALQQAAEMERAALRAEAEHARARARMEAELAEARTRAEASVETARMEAEARRIVAEAAAEAEKLRRAAADEVSPSRLRAIALTETGPELARALRGAFGEITVRPGELAELGSLVREVWDRVDG